ncbi:DUF5656 family protein [Candidatus Viridilinea mediisalina]|uniref:Uncharacterized protein n=1 Tax=Candidatus Viridilinea mediisalina TaxID=2024553 RepID=A0A2A6RMG6_9CHLR|nr:hypothetical protein [Candidatus Viridilinea mediisalina]PDW04133.1 hypothetical protein CJ255_05425 [Candidatus Viridilinea mediisalina]
MLKAAPLPRFERIVSLIFVILIGLAVIFLIDTNPNTLRIVLGGDLPTIGLSWFLIGALAVITSAGADLLARGHPQMQYRTLPQLNFGVVRFEVVPSFWILPSFSVIGSFAFFRLFSDAWEGAAFALALVAAGGSLLAVLVAQHYSLDRNAELNQRAQLVLQALGYLLAFGVFSAIYYTGYRTLYSASMVGVSGTLLAYALLTTPTRSQDLLLSVLVGLLLAQATWALNYWATTFLIAGTVLLVCFYLMVSLLQHLAAGRLQQRMIMEYGLLGGGLFLVIVYVTLQLG